MDLPGYGYAKVAKSERTAWQRLIEDYLIHAPNLCGVVIILDIRRGPEAEEPPWPTFWPIITAPFSLWPPNVTNSSAPSGRSSAKS